MIIMVHITKATTFKDGVIAEASTLMQQEKSVCDAANNKRLTFLDSDQKVIDELTPLLAKLSTCSGPIAPIIFHQHVLLL